MADRKSKRQKAEASSSSSAAVGGTSSAGTAPSSRAATGGTAAVAGGGSSSSSSGSGNRSSHNKFSTFHKAIFQIFSSYGCLSDQKMKEMIKTIKSDFQPHELGTMSPSLQVPVTDAELRSLFGFMNPELRKLNFEIRTVAIPSKRTGGSGSGSGGGGSSSSAAGSSAGASSEDELKIYHGLVNTSDDKVAELYGSTLQAKETNLLKEILNALIISGRHKLSTTDIQDDVRPTETGKKMSQTEVEDILHKLHHEQWLDRDDRNFFIIGPRTYLELKTVLEGMIEDSLASEGGVDARGARMALPQVLLH